MTIAKGWYFLESTEVQENLDSLIFQNQDDLPKDLSGLRPWIIYSYIIR